MNVTQVSIARPTTKGFDEVVGYTSQSSRGGRADAETMAGVISRNPGGGENGSKPTVHHGGRKRGTILTDEKGARGRSRRETYRMRAATGQTDWPEGPRRRKQPRRNGSVLEVLRKGRKWPAGS